MTAADARAELEAALWRMAPHDHAVALVDTALAAADAYAVTHADETLRGVMAAGRAS